MNHFIQTAISIAGEAEASLEVKLSMELELSRGKWNDVDTVTG